MLSLNYFTAGTCVKIVKGKLQVLLVLYYDDSDHKKVHEYRLPGGTIQISDVITTIEKLGDKLHLSEQQYNFLIMKIEELSEKTEAKISSMPSITNDQKVQRRILFVEALKKIEAILIQTLPTLSELKLFQRTVKLVTLKRELEQECAVINFSDAVECGNAQRGEHTQYPYLVLDPDAPDSYKGGSDKDIVESMFMDIEEACSLIYKYHKMFLNNTLSRLSHILGYEKDKLNIVKEIELCLKENQA